MKLIIGGDMCVTAGNAEAFENMCTSELFNDIPDFFKTADRVIINLECALTDKETPIKKFGPNLQGPVNTAKVLKEAGVSDCLLSNNHIFDFGKAGLSDTLSALDENGINYTGIGENELDSRKDMIITDGNIKIALINVCEHEYSYALEDRVGARPYDAYDTNDDIQAAKENADYVIVAYHGGKEHCQYPSPRLRKLCRSMVKHGADVVLCQHSHCIGCYEEFNGAHILYGQGNFHFTKFEFPGMSPKWLNGLLVKLNMDEKCDIEFVPVVTEDVGMRIANAEEKKEILDAFEVRNRILKEEKWRAEWHKFCEENRENYEDAIRGETYDKFSHYLDCEAHTDVWRELFPTWNMTNEK